MANRLYNKQVTPKGYKMGGRVKKMGGGMMKRKPMMKGSKPDFLDCMFLFLMSFPFDTPDLVIFSPFNF